MTLTARAVACVVASSLLAACCSGEGPQGGRASQSGSAPANALLGVVWAPSISWGFRGGELVRLDPRTLAPLGPRLSLSRYVSFAWSLSPDRSKLVFGGLAPSLRFVDARRVHRLGDVELGGRGTVIATSWPLPGRVLAVVQRPFAEGEVRLVLVDAASRRVFGRRRLADRSEVVDVARTSDGLALLVAPADSVGPTRLVVADADGSVRSARIDAVAGGTRAVRSADRSYAFEQRWFPGLAVDPVGRRAFVVGGGARVAEVELATMRVAYHVPDEPVSWLGRLREWFEPAALAKGESEGPVRSARWLGEGLLAVSGWDAHVTEPPRAAGLKLIDTGDWTVRTLDPETGGFTAAGQILLAHGCCFARGLTAYDRDGTRLWHRFGERTIASVEATERLAYVYRYARRRSWVEVLDLVSGKTLRMVDAPWFEILDGEGPRWPPH